MSLPGGDGSFEKTVVCEANVYGGLQSKADGEGVTKGVVGVECAASSGEDVSPRNHSI